MLALRVLIRSKSAVGYDPFRSFGLLILLSCLLFLLVSPGCSSIVGLFAQEDGPCSISGNCQVSLSKPFRVTVYDHENYGLRYFRGKFDDPAGDYRIDGLPVDIVDIYFEADECFPDKLIDVRLEPGLTVVDTVSVRFTPVKSINRYNITLKRGDSILWPHGYEGEIEIDRLDFKSPAFKNFLIDIGVISLHKRFPDQEEGVPDYFETRLGYIIDLSIRSRKYFFYVHDLKDFSLALDMRYDLNRHQDIARADVVIGGIVNFRD